MIAPAMALRKCSCILLALAAAIPSAARAQERSYVLTAWTEETGLPSGEILAMTQDLDGYLWLGTSDGLVRFDGARFVTRRIVAGGASRVRAVPALVAGRDGSLWVGHGSGGVTRIGREDVVEYGTQEGLPGGAVAMLLQDRAGIIWAGTREGLARFADGRWETVYKDAEVFSLFEDSAGRLWMGTSVGVFARSGSRMDVKYPEALYVQHFAEDATGALWVTDLQNIVRPLASDRLPAHAPDVRLPQSGWRTVRDRAGRIWVAALGGGLLRLSGNSRRQRDQPDIRAAGVRSEDEAPALGLQSAGGDERPVIERVPYEHVIAGAARSLLYDADGNVWVGMRPKGLLRLSQRFVTADIPLEGLTNDGVRAMAASTDGSVWIGTGHSLLRFDGAARDVFDVAQTRVLHIDAERRVWAVTTSGLYRIENRRLVPVVLPDHVRWDRVTSMATDSSGSLWLCSTNQGVLAWRDGVLTPFDSIPGISSRNCSYAYADRSGRVWFGFGTGDVAVHQRGTFRSYGSQDGLAGGTVLAIIEDRAGVAWVATRNGVSRYRNERFVTLTNENGPFEEIVALVEDEQGYLWVGVHTGAGVVRFDPREVDKVAVDSGRHMEYRLFDTSDGMLGELRPLIRAAGVRGADGRLWFATGLGVVILDPARLPPNSRPNRPRIEDVFVDGRRIDRSGAPTLPSGTSTLAVEYTTASLGAASKLRFRHRLEGLDSEWVQAGPDRMASYENLPAGRYRFQVSATTDGVWTEAAAWAFGVAPPFYQQTWFLILCTAGTATVIGGAWWLRVDTLRHRYALVFEERARVSREVHDTLLQSLAAVGVELETIAAQLDGSQTPARESLRRLRRQVGHSLRDARDSIWGLRHNQLESRGLVEALREFSEATSTGRRVRVELSVSGRAVPCPAEAELQLLRICQEAVRNAIRHGAATHIHVVLEFAPGALVLSVSDNGRGFVVVDDGTSGDAGEHLGLLGMRERAERISARITITSSPGKGTTVEVTAPLASG
jgi:signal transduction histidine kinase/ligand-binding sensor domain-containing protein